MVNAVLALALKFKTTHSSDDALKSCPRGFYQKHVAVIPDDRSREILLSEQTAIANAIAYTQLTTLSGHSMRVSAGQLSFTLSLCFTRSSLHQAFVSCLRSLGRN